MKITTQKTGGIWHGYLEGHPEVDERGLTEEKAREKVQRILEARGWKVGYSCQLRKRHGISRKALEGVTRRCR